MEQPEQNAEQQKNCTKMAGAHHIPDHSFSVDEWVGKWFLKYIVNR